MRNEPAGILTNSMPVTGSTQTVSGASGLLKHPVTSAPAASMNRSRRA